MYRRKSKHHPCYPFACSCNHGMYTSPLPSSYLDPLRNPPFLTNARFDHTMSACHQICSPYLLFLASLVPAHRLSAGKAKHKKTKKKRKSHDTGVFFRQRVGSRRLVRRVLVSGETGRVQSEYVAGARNLLGTLHSVVFLL